MVAEFCDVVERIRLIATRRLGRPVIAYSLNRELGAAGPLEEYPRQIRARRAHSMHMRLAGWLPSSFIHQHSQGEVRGPCLF